VWPGSGHDVDGKWTSRGSTDRDHPATLPARAASTKVINYDERTRMTIARIAAGLALVAATLLGGAATATAATPAPAAATSANSMKPNDFVDYVKVWAWHDVNARLGCAGTTCPVDKTMSMKAGDYAYGHCWKRGETITAYGITNDIWILISLEDGGARFVSAVFLKGDKYANLPANGECPPYI